MTLDEIIKLNAIIFGTRTPKIRVINSKMSYEWIEAYQQPENIFFYFGENTHVDVMLGNNDFVIHCKDYVNLKDLLQVSSWSPKSASLSFQLVYPRIYAPVYTDAAFYIYDAKDNQVIIDPQAGMPGTFVPTDITNQPTALGISAGVDSSTRIYIIEYDQTKIMKL